MAAGTDEEMLKTPTKMRHTLKGAIVFFTSLQMSMNERWGGHCSGW